MSRTVTLAEFVRDLKRDSSLWIKTLEEAPKEFDWQDGYGAFSISPSHVGRLVNYIETQEEHHRTEGFQDEFRRLLAKYGLEYDEQYVWD
jgi:putative transposase